MIEKDSSSSKLNDAGAKPVLEGLNIPPPPPSMAANVPVATEHLPKSSDEQVPDIEVDQVKNSLILKWEYSHNFLDYRLDCLLSLLFCKCWRLILLL